MSFRWDYVRNSKEQTGGKEGQRFDIERCTCEVQGSLGMNFYVCVCDNLVLPGPAFPQASFWVPVILQ